MLLKYLARRNEITGFSVKDVIEIVDSYSLGKASNFESLVVTCYAMTAVIGTAWLVSEVAALLVTVFSLLYG
jgi:hypothetical protein